MPINCDTVQEFLNQKSLTSIIELGNKENFSALPHFKEYINVSHDRIYDFISGVQVWDGFSLISGQKRNKYLFQHLPVLLSKRLLPNQVLLATRMIFLKK